MITRSDTLKKSDEPQWWQSQDCGMQNHKIIGYLWKVPDDCWLKSGNCEDHSGPSKLKFLTTHNVRC